MLTRKSLKFSQNLTKIHQIHLTINTLYDINQVPALLHLHW